MLQKGKNRRREWRFEWKHANSNQAATDNTLLSPMSLCESVFVCCLLFMVTVAIKVVN